MLASVAFSGAALVALFWALYFSGAADLGQADVAARAFEAAFPVADALLAAALAATGIAALRRRPAAWYFLTVAAAMTMYLGLLDTTFYLAHGLYARRDGAALAELAINALCIGGGAAGLACAWRRRSQVEPRP
jgi:hypothetical protein